MGIPREQQRALLLRVARPEMLQCGLEPDSSTQALATAILDRLLHRSHVLNISGRSYRLRDLERLATRGK